jgi:hypothetical protein
MSQKLILSGRLGKWVYALVEYDLKYETPEGQERDGVG